MPRRCPHQGCEKWLIHGQSYCAKHQIEGRKVAITANVQDAGTFIPCEPSTSASRLSVLHVSRGVAQKNESNERGELLLPHELNKERSSAGDLFSASSRDPPLSTSTSKANVPPVVPTTPASAAFHSDATLLTDPVKHTSHALPPPPPPPPPRYHGHAPPAPAHQASPKPTCASTAGRPEPNPTTKPILGVSCTQISDEDDHSAKLSTAAARVSASSSDEAHDIGDETIMRGTLENCIAKRGNVHPATLQAASELGLMLQGDQRHDEAEALLRQVWRGQRQINGQNHPDTLAAASNLGVLLLERGSMVDHTSTSGTSSNNSGVVASVAAVDVTGRRTDALDEAEHLLRDALRGYTAMCGPRHPDTLTSIDLLSQLLQQRPGALSEAEGLSRQALEGREFVLGSRHEDTLSSKNNLGQLLLARYHKGAGDGGLGRMEHLLNEAVQVLSSAVTDCRAGLGDTHPFTLAAIHNLASARVLQPDGAIDAEVLYRQALDGRRVSVGAYHPDTLTSTYDLAVLLQSQGRIKEAVPLFRTELEGCRRNLGDDHEDTEHSRTNLEAVLHDVMADEE